MTEDEIDKIVKEMMETTRIERERAAEYDKLSYIEKLARRKGHANGAEYRNWIAQQRGFVNYADYVQDYCFKKGIGTGLSMAENKNSAQYLGIHIAERLLPKIFKEPRMMPFGNKGYDAICKNGNKIDIKSSLIGKKRQWLFTIRHNIVADAFLCIAFSGSRKDLVVKHIWLFPGNEIVRTCSLNEMKGLIIYNTDFSLSGVARYELTDKVDDANDVCVLFKKGVLK